MRLAGPLEAKIGETDQIPDFRDTTKFFRELVPADGQPEPDAWAVAYRPDFGRFSTGQSRGELLWEWNPKATGLKTSSEKMPERIWLIRTRPIALWSFGLIWDNGRVGYSSDRATLGLGPSPVIG